MIVAPGLRRFLGRNPLNTSAFFAPLTHSLILTRGTGNPTYTRATTAYVADFEGLLKQVPSGCARFSGARFVRNLVALPESAPNETNSVTIGSGITDPNGGTKAFTVSATSANGFADWNTTGLVAGTTKIGSLWIRRRTGTGDIKLFTSSGASGSIVTITTSWQRFTNGAAALAATTGYVGVVVVTSGDAVDIAFPQIEDVTGQTNQNPSEYVSVGSLSAPYHGAGIDGAKYFSTLNGNTVASNVVTEATGAAINSTTSKFGVLPGAVASYFSTPDSAAASITGDIDIRADVAIPDWTPGSVSVTPLVNKAAGAPNRGYAFYIDNSGLLTFSISVDGTSVSGAVASATTGITDATRAWVRVARVASTGTCTFYKSTDGGVTWTQIGTTQATTAGNLYDNGQEVRIGTYFGAYSTTGNIYRAQIYNGISGTLAVDFNPNLSTTAQTFTAATGEVWTSNGGARIYGNTDTTYGIPATWDATGPLGYQAEGARTNLCLQSQTFGTTWGVGASASVIENTVVAPDGTTTADSFVTTDTTANAYVLQSFASTLAAAVHTESIYLKAGTTTSVILGLITGGYGLGGEVTVNLSAGTVSAVTHYGASNDFAATIEPAVNGFYRVTLKGTTTASTTWYYQVRGAQAGTCYLWGAQLEAAAFASSYIPTTTIAVARNADVLTYASAGNISGTVGTAYAEFQSVEAVTGFKGVIGSSGNDNLPIGVNSTSTIAYDGTNVVAKTGSVAANSLVKAASSWAASSLKVTAGGATPTSGAFDGSMAPSPIGIGVYNGGNQLFGNIRNTRIWLDAKSDATMQTITTP